MTGDGGKNDSGARGGAGGPLGRSVEDGGDVPVHAEPWRLRCSLQLTLLSSILL
jgi:hypothetical protein